MDIGRILAHFPDIPAGAATDARTSSDGLINATWLIGDAFVLQRVNPIFGPRVNEDMLALTEHARTKGVPVPRLLLSRTGAPYVDDEGIWRAMTQLSGRTVHRVSSPGQAMGAARLVAHFHDALADSTHRFAFTRPGAHDTPSHMRALEGAVRERDDHHLAPVVETTAREIVARWRALSAPAPLPRRIVHGDLKISNVLFGDDDDAVGLIDLDTMAWSDLEVEMGDALRSWCSTTDENAPKPELDVDVFEAAVTTYVQSSRGLTEAERLGIVRGLERITLELSARFATDALHESYFGWSPAVAETRGEHNLIRALNQLELARQIARHRDDLSAIVTGAAS